MNLLHLSDIHYGLTAQGWLMPAFETAFFEDIRKLHKKTGNWDCVVFSGDLTQKGTPDEYAALTVFLKKLWSIFKSLGCNPVLVPIPGNHDLQRPESLDPTAKIMQDWWKDPDIREAFWKQKPPAYWDLVQSIFSHYRNWLKEVSTSIPLPELKLGLLPGDISTTLQINDRALGLIGLNSAWLQVAAGDFFGKLQVDIRQILGVTQNNPDEWCQRNDANLIVTHHPISWLHKEALLEWRSDIDREGRFDAHLFGHMHDPSTNSTSIGGAKIRNSIQAASLFGLETIEGSNETRIHGYSAITIQFNESEKSIRIWPRKSVVVKNGTRKLIADFEFELDDDESFLIDGKKTSSVQLSSISEAIHPQNFGLKLGDELDAIKKRLPPTGSHAFVRTVEQEAALSVLKDRRAFWLTSDWGSGDFEFIHSICHRLGPNIGIYELDCQNFNTGQELIDGVKQTFGISFEKICETLSNMPQSLLLLTDIKSRDQAGEIAGIQQDLNSIVSTLLDFCKSTYVILQSRSEPAKSDYRSIRLSSFDEADTATYLRHHEKTAGLQLTSQLVSQIYQHTDGVPIRIDSVLIDASIVGISELHTLNADVVSNAVSLSRAPIALVAVVNELSMSEDPSLKRAYELLKILALFPKGERLDAVKRLNPKFTFYPQDVHILVERILIDVVEMPSISSSHSKNFGAVLVVKRPVREYLHASMPSSEVRTLNRKILDAYFGSEWQLKGIRTSKGPKFDNRNCDTWQIANAAMIVLRFTKEAIENGAMKKIKAALDLTTAFYAALISGDHYYNIVASSADLVPLFENLQSPELDLILLKTQRARSLRMTTEFLQARDAYLEIKDSEAPKTLKSQILLGLAITHNTLKEEEAAVSVARECARINPRSHSALQARSIIADAEDDEALREKELAEIEEKARKKKAFIVANNIAIQRVNSLENLEEQKILSKKLYQKAKEDGDLHNAMRAFLRFAEATIKTGGLLTSSELDVVIESYHYLYGESFRSLFISCHEILWNQFYKSGQIDNLLRLFRLSSIIWRFRGQEETELRYLNSAKERLKSEVLEHLISSPAAAYFFARASFLLK